MAKAKTSDLTAFGFVPAQFGDPKDWDIEDGFLDRLLDRFGAEVSDRVGASAYAAAASGVDFERMRAAEKYFAVAELWRIRAQRVDASMQAADSEANAPLQLRYLDNAEKYDSMALAQLAQITKTTPDSGVAAGYVETGQYATGV